MRLTDRFELLSKGNKQMDDVSSIDSIIHALYEVISGPAGQEREWDRDRNLFYPGAHLIRTVIGDDGAPRAVVMDIETYIKDTADFFLRNGFYEWEIARKTDRFGNIAHVLSTYEAKYNLEDPQPLKYCPRIEHL
jgi:hypothetical protein